METFTEDQKKQRVYESLVSQGQTDEMARKLSALPRWDAVRWKEFSHTNGADYYGKAEFKQLERAHRHADWVDFEAPKYKGRTE
jgi:hypothetical protein